MLSTNIAAMAAAPAPRVPSATISHTSISSTAAIVTAQKSNPNAHSSSANRRYSRKPTAMPRYMGRIITKVRPCESTGAPVSMTGNVDSAMTAVHDVSTVAPSQRSTARSAGSPRVARHCSSAAHSVTTNATSNIPDAHCWFGVRCHVLAAHHAPTNGSKSAANAGRISGRGYTRNSAQSAPAKRLPPA